MRLPTSVLALALAATIQLFIGHNAAEAKSQIRTPLASEKDGSYWLAEGLNYIKNRLTRREITSRAKNIIMFLGDGMSFPTITAARIYHGQQQGQPGEESRLSFDLFPWVGLSKTYCVNSQVADSACSSTAYLGGVKANKDTIGVTADVKLNDCQAMVNTSNHVSSVLAWAQQAGKSTGVVTTTRVTHASPAGTYAHTANRDWESDADVLAFKKNPEVCLDIARQLITELPGRDINVVLGGGRAEFVPKELKDEDGKLGKRADFVDLIKAWMSDKELRNSSYEYVFDREGLSHVKTSKTDYLLGLFSSSHMPYSLHANTTKRPPLSLMVRKALEVLKKNPQGYFLFVEGGRIDHAHHSTEARRALHETVEFSEAIEEALKTENKDDTLIIVTADHAHTMTMSGYPVRGNDILGLAGQSKVDHLPYATLSYANGPANHDRHDLSHDHMEIDDYKYPSAVPQHSETHGGEDVGIFARGPWAHLLSGVMEQSSIASVMSYAACIGPHRTVCETQQPNNVQLNSKK